MVVPYYRIQRVQAQKSRRSGFTPRRMLLIKENSFTLFLQDISRHPKNINGWPKIDDQRITRMARKGIYEVYDGAKSDTAFSFVALQSIRGLFYTRLAYRTSPNCTRRMYRQE